MVSKKRILNLTSRKKRDTMPPRTNMVNGAGPTIEQDTFPVLAPPAVDGTPPVFVWVPTARQAEDFSNTPGMLHNPTVRTATNCYMVGLKEVIHIETASSAAWAWRRICFTYKGPDLHPDNTSLDPADAEYWRETSNGYNRLWNVPSTANRAALFAIIFKGAQGIDWRDTPMSGFLTARLDTTRINVKYDKTRRVVSGNDNGVMRTHKLWHPMRANLQYDEDEQGDYTETTAVSTTGKVGMGDYYVVDFFIPTTGASTNDQLLINSTSTLYWHER